MVRAPRATRLLTHGQVWAALDRLAERAGMSPSGLARRAGLDPTTFNKSKRITADGRERWPSTESVAKALTATNVSIDSFVQLMGDSVRGAATVPLIGLAAAASGDAFDDSGLPSGEGWDEIALPAVPDEHAYALEISGDALRPVLRDGDVILASPSAPIRRGDRVVVRTKEGELLVKECKRRTARTLELQSLNPAEPDRVLAPEEVAWIARIVWVKL